MASSPTSTRERWLWASTLACVTVIYAAVVPAAPIAAALRARGLLGPTTTIAIAATGVVAGGWLDEVLQSLVPGRVHDVADVALDAAAGVLALGVACAMRLALAVERRAPPALTWRAACSMRSRWGLGTTS